MRSMGARRPERHGWSGDQTVTGDRVAPGTARRVMRVLRPHRRLLILYLVVVVLDGLVAMVGPLTVRGLIDQGVVARQRAVVVELTVAVAVLAILDAGLTLVGRWLSAVVGEALVFDLRSTVFRHVQRQPLAFFSRTQTGSLVGRLNSDMLGAPRALADLLANVGGSAFVAGFVLVAMAALSWPLTLAALAAMPLFGLPARAVGRRVSALTRERYGLLAAMGNTMTERFNVSGATLTKLFADPERDVDTFDRQGAALRDVSVQIAVRSRVSSTALALLAAVAAAAVYGWGGLLAVDGAVPLGTLVAMTAYLGRLYGPLAALSNAHVDIATMLVSFQRLFEVLDLEPVIAERPGAVELARGPTAVELDHVDFTYASAARVSVATLEAVAALDGREGAAVLHDVSFRAAPGELVALVGPSGAGKTTISLLVPRLHDVTGGQVRLGGTDVREVTLASLRAKVGVVTQDPHLFHDTLRANLELARPGATDGELRQALGQAQVGHLVDLLPDGLDTVLGERGYRISAGEKQRVALARVILKDPDVVILDEATAHLDAESEAALQRALAVALTGRTSLVIAHRLSTIRRADRIVVVDGGRVVDQGTHLELLARPGLYARLHRLQSGEGLPPGGSPAPEGRGRVHLARN